MAYAPQEHGNNWPDDQLAAVGRRQTQAKPAA